MKNKKYLLFLYTFFISIILLISFQNIAFAADPKLVNTISRAFEKIELQPGETKTVTLKIKASDLAFVGHDGKWILEKGTFKIQIGNQITNINCVETNKWSTPNI